MDFLVVFLQGTLPSLIDNDHTLSNRDGHLPPCGFHRYSTTGAATVVYCSTQHLEGPIDPDWTMGICFNQGEASGGVYNFVMSCADGGRGLITENGERTVMVWPGKTVMYGTTVDSTTYEVDRGEKIPSVGITLYLKKTALNIG